MVGTDVKLLIVRVTAELPRYYEYYDSLERMVVPPNTGVLAIHSSSPAKNKNIAIKQALDDGSYTHVFLTDDDHVYPPDTIQKLLSRQVDVVSGVYCMKMSPFPMIAFDRPNEKGQGAFLDFNKFSGDECVEVARVPSGCLLVTTYALDEIAKCGCLDQAFWQARELGFNSIWKNKWFTLGQIEPDNWCDDLWFCDRARDAGFKIYIDTGVKIGHVTKCVLTPHYEDGKWSIKFGINEGISIKGLNE